MGRWKLSEFQGYQNYDGWTVLQCAKHSNCFIEPEVRFEGVIFGFAKNEIEKVHIKTIRSVIEGLFFSL